MYYQNTGNDYMWVVCMLYEACIRIRCLCCHSFTFIIVVCNLNHFSQRVYGLFWRVINFTYYESFLTMSFHPPYSSQDVNPCISPCFYGIGYVLPLGQNNVTPVFQQKQYIHNNRKFTRQTECKIICQSRQEYVFRSDHMHVIIMLVSN